MHAKLENLYLGKNLSANEIEDIFTSVFKGEIDPIVFSSLLTALKMKGETPEEIAGAARAMVKAARYFPRPDGIEIGEIVGTGGDGMNSINISSMSALCAAAAGLHIAKHGNRGVSSKTGASDLLTALGFDINATPEEGAELLKKSGFMFCFAQLYHPAMRFAVPVRKALATRTIFNILGPLTNPAHPDYAVIGVYSPSLIVPVARTLGELGMKRAFVVHGSGFDEVCIHGNTLYAQLEENGSITTGEFTPAVFGVTKTRTPADLEGGDPALNAEIAMQILSGKGTEAQNEMVCANLALLLQAGKAVRSIREGVELARDILASGKALEVVNIHREFAAAKAAANKSA